MCLQLRIAALPYPLSLPSLAQSLNLAGATAAEAEAGFCPFRGTGSDRGGRGTVAWLCARGEKASSQASPASSTVNQGEAGRCALDREAIGHEQGSGDPDLQDLRRALRARP
eukprot:scaffold1396_cov252-Pinguiococcus_pyrenoidosus.AAC.8